jgi:hypothetical protein
MWIISASGWLFKKKCITMHGNMNVKHIPVTDNLIVGCFCTDMGGKGRGIFTALCRYLETKVLSLNNESQTGIRNKCQRFGVPSLMQGCYVNIIA